MPGKRRTSESNGKAKASGTISLRGLAASLSLSPTTVSLVLNHSPGADSIPQATKDRVVAEARRLKYRPDYVARLLRAKRSYSIGVMVPELSEGYASLVVAGIEETLMRRGYMYLATSHRHSARQMELLPQLLWERAVEGLILVDTPSDMNVPLPIVAVSGHDVHDGVTNVVLNHDLAADLGIRHLIALGHRRIAVMKGQEFSSDTEIRWQAIERAAREQGAPIDPEIGGAASRRRTVAGHWVRGGKGSVAAEKRVYRAIRLQ